VPALDKSLVVAFKVSDLCCDDAAMHRGNNWAFESHEYLTSGKMRIPFLGGCIPNDPMHQFRINHSLWGPFLPAATMVNLISDFGLRGCPLRVGSFRYDTGFLFLMRKERQ